jgi:glycosyltransferase involved in cell wall biosynthesis
MNVSVIIPTTDKEKNMLDMCIHAINASLMFTAYKVETIIVNEGLERSTQRNIGIRRAQGEYLLILDTDQIIQFGLIDNCMEIIKECKAIYIPEQITTPGFFGRLRNWERQFYTATVVDVVRFLRKKDCPFFDENQSGTEDSDWDRRIGGTRRIADASIFHKDDVSFWQYCRKKMYYTKSMGIFAERNPGDKILDLRYRCFGIYTENDKWKRLLQKPHYTIALVGLIIVRGVIYLCTRRKH